MEKEAAAMEILEPGLDNFDLRSSITRSERLLITFGNSIGVHFSLVYKGQIIGCKVINLSFGLCVCMPIGLEVHHKKRCELLLMVFRGTSLGIFGPPPRIRIMPTPIQGA